MTGSETRRPTADWAILSAMEVDPDGRAVDAFHVLVPTADLSVAVSVAGGGLRGTGCHDLATDGVDVPAHRVVRTFDVAQLSAPGRQVNTGPLHGMPWGMLHAHAVTAPVIGAAQGSFRAVADQGREAMRLSLGGATLAEGVRLRASLARTAADIDAAVLQTERNLVEAYEAAQRGTGPDVALRLRARRDQVRATERCLAAVDNLFTDRHRLMPQRGGLVERAWRDVHAAHLHVANDAERAYDHYGALELGLSVEEDLM